MKKELKGFVKNKKIVGYGQVCLPAVFSDSPGVWVLAVSDSLGWIAVFAHGGCSAFFRGPRPVLIG